MGETSGMSRSFGMVGRDQELVSLVELIAHAVRGSGRVAVIEGEAGVGKSTLTNACVAEASHRDVDVCCGGGHELSRDRPFGIIADALSVTSISPDEQGGHIASLLGTDAGPSSGLRFRILDDLVDLVESRAQRGPLVIALEDVHWADTSTLLATERLLRRVATLPVLLLMTCRPVPRSPELVSVLDTVRQLGGLELTLDPLDRAACSELAAQSLGATPGPDLEDVLAQAGGNPFFLLELLGALQDDGAIAVRGELAVSTRAAVPASLRLVVLRRLGFLADEVLDVLRLAAVLGTSFSLGELAAVSRRPATALLAPITDLVRAGLVGEAGDRLAFRHELVRDAVYQDLPLSVRRDLHREAGRLLADAGAGAERVAGQMALGASVGDTEAISWLRRAAQDARPRDPRAAAELLDHATQLVGADAALRIELAHERAAALLWAGSHRDAEDVARRALGETADRVKEAALRRRLAEAMFLQGRAQEASEEVERAVRTGGLPDSEIPRALAEASGSAILGGDLRRATTLADESLASTANDPAHADDGLALTVRGWIADLHGEFELSAALVRRAAAVGDQPDKIVALYGHPHLILGAFLASLGATPTAEGVLQVGRERVEQAGTAWDLPVFHGAMGLVHLWRGDWDDALAEIETSFAWTREFGSTLGIPWPLSVRARLEVHRGDVGAADRTLALASEFLGGGPQFGMGWLLWARAELLEAQGDIDGAIASLEAGVGVGEALGTVTQFIDVGPDLVRLLVRAGRQGRAAEIAGRIQQLDHGDVAIVSAAALRARGLADDDPDVLVKAMAAFAASPRPMLEAFVAEDAAGALAHAGRRAEAVEFLQRASDGYQRMGATWDLGRVEASLRELGVRRGRRGGRPKVATGWESLSGTERRVVALVVDGLTNRSIGERLYISSRTVETHVSHVFAKLGVSSRVELAAMAARREGTG